MRTYLQFCLKRLGFIERGLNTVNMLNCDFCVTRLISIPASLLKICHKNLLAASIFQIDGCLMLERRAGLIAPR